MKEIFNLDQQLLQISSLKKALLEGHISAVEIAKDTLSKIDKSAELNCFINIDEELTLDQAKKADLSISNGTASSLTGIPIAHKDIFVTKGWKTTAASKMLKNYISPFNATIVEKLMQAGAISFGKLNCDEFGMGSNNKNSYFGPVKNPWDSNATPGGSSGGSAAAVAARLVYAATATDTGGSIRLPAAMCGVSGIRPTYGTISRFGMIAFGSSLDQAGPIALSSQDLLEILDSMSGFDPKDPTSLQYCNDKLNQPGRIRNDFYQSEKDFNAFSKSKPLDGLRIGIPSEYFCEDLSTEIFNAIESALIQFEKLGAKRVNISLPHTKFSIPAYYIISSAEASSNLARYDGVRYGHRCKNYNNLEKMISRSRAEGFGNEVKRRILTGTFVLSQNYFNDYYLQANKLRKMITKDFQDAFSYQCDIIIGPVTPNISKNIHEDINDSISDWLTDIYTLGASLAGLPAMSIPCGFGGINSIRPIGLQLIGNYFKEGFLLTISNWYQNITDWHQKFPKKGVI
ncbi:MAG: Asp-tRNA(Asn)/Glu-tRNA(Gln) amidotransferase subunit GatA [Bordetella sp.]|nr:MAG: Asp-tRNA(Asn)/Glu-tRNA(Gln) amidotransferase subunit GatA [Bordetella sp.]